MLTPYIKLFWLYIHDLPLSLWECWFVVKKHMLCNNDVSHMTPSTLIVMHKTILKYPQFSVWHFIDDNGIDMDSKIINSKLFAFSFTTYSEHFFFFFFLELINQPSEICMSSFLFNDTPIYLAFVRIIYLAHYTDRIK